MNRADIPFLTVAELGELIRNGEVSPVEATETYLGRINSFNDEIRAYLTVTDELARQAARDAESEIAAGNYRGPLHGIPVAVKDQIYTRGVRTTGGSPVFDEFVPGYDATVITRLKEAGAVLLGKLNMTEFATTGLSHQFDPPAQPVGPRAFQRRLQQRQRRRHRRFHVRRVAGRGHRWFGALPRRLVRAGRAAPHLGTGQPLRGDAGRPLHGHHRPSGAHC